MFWKKRFKKINDRIYDLELDIKSIIHRHKQEDCQHKNIQFIYPAIDIYYTSPYETYKACTDCKKVFERYQSSIEAKLAEASYYKQKYEEALSFTNQGDKEEDSNIKL